MHEYREAELWQTADAPADATDEELRTVSEARKAGYKRYSVELFRLNRSKALPALDAILGARGDR